MLMCLRDYCVRARQVERGCATLIMCINLMSISVMYTNSIKSASDNSALVGACFGIPATMLAALSPKVIVMAVNVNMINIMPVHSGRVSGIALSL